jgi:hypothetical protein
MKPAKATLVVICLVACITGFSQPAPNAPWVFQSGAGDYVLTIPAGWREITKAEFDTQGKLFKERTGNAPSEYETGFQISGRRPFEYPYIFVERSFLTPISYTDLKTRLKSQVTAGGTKDVSQETGSLMHTAVHEYSLPRSAKSGCFGFGGKYA